MARLPRHSAKFIGLVSQLLAIDAFGLAELAAIVESISQGSKKA
jgi:rRNA pseudouridine-1189 N-methylase Emg1 (Nep1/Mra1 family)